MTSEFKPALFAIAAALGWLGLAGCGGGSESVEPAPAGNQQTASGALVPLSWDDPVFASVRNSGPVSPSPGQSASNLSIVEQSGDASIYCSGSCTLDHIRIRSREGYRCSSGNQNLSWMWIEATGIGSDHADGIQCYAPGSTGTLTVRNSTIKLGGSAINAAYFSADGWKGSHVLENVLLWGGNSCFFVPGDGGSSISLTNVYIMKNSCGLPFRLDTVNGQRPAIVKWENVRFVTLENGTLVMGAEIKRPY